MTAIVLGLALVVFAPASGAKGFGVILMILGAASLVVRRVEAVRW